MTHILAIANQKGGVGKTTTVVNLAASLAHLGQRVLLVDLDPQGNATMSCGVDKSQLHHSVYSVLLGDSSVEEARKPVVDGAFDVLPANRHLAGAEVELVSEPLRERRLQKALLPVHHAYDYILLDCPPALNLLTLNGLVAAQGVIIPMQCEYFALEGIADLVNTLRQLKKTLNPKIEIEGIVRTLFDGRSMLVQQVAQQLKDSFGNKVFNTLIPRNIRLAEAPSYGLPALYYDKNARGAVAYLELAAELLKRHSKEQVDE